MKRWRVSQGVQQPAHGGHDHVHPWSGLTLPIDWWPGRVREEKKKEVKDLRLYHSNVSQPGGQNLSEKLFKGISIK